MTLKNKKNRNINILKYFYVTVWVKKIVLQNKKILGSILKLNFFVLLHIYSWGICYLIWYLNVFNIYNMIFELVPQAVLYEMRSKTSEMVPFAHK